jgi:hypothetical protein
MPSILPIHSRLARLEDKMQRQGQRKGMEEEASQPTLPQYSFVNFDVGCFAGREAALWLKKNAYLKKKSYATNNTIMLAQLYYIYMVYSLISLK